MTQKKRSVLFLASLLAVLASCSSMQVAVNYDEQADFKAYRTFFMAPPKGDKPGPASRPLFNRQVLNEIKTLLEKKGLMEALDRESADLVVHFYAMVKNKRDFAPPSYRVGRWGRVWAVRPGHVVRYKEGTLIIDMEDRAKKELVWEGEGKDILDRTNPSRNLVEAAGKVLESFPPGR